MNFTSIDRQIKSLERRIDGMKRLNARRPHPDHNLEQNSLLIRNWQEKVDYLKKLRGEDPDTKPDCVGCNQDL